MSTQWDSLRIIFILTLIFLIVSCGDVPKDLTGPIEKPENTISTVPVIPPEGVVTNLQVNKTADVQFKHFLDWTLTKTAEPTVAELCVNEDLEINYTVTVSQKGYTEEYWVHGIITIVNEDGAEGEDKTAYIEYVDDAVQALVNGEWITIKRARLKSEFTIETGGSLDIGYWQQFVPPENYEGLRNVAFVLLKNHTLGPTPKEFSDMQEFTIPETPIIGYKSVDVVDVVDLPDALPLHLGTVSYQETPVTFTYSRTFNFETPGIHDVVNTATATYWEYTLSTAVATVSLTVEDCAECQEETAWGGSTIGDGIAWWYYFDATVGEQTIWAGQDINIGTVTYRDGQLTIELTGGWTLQDDPEAVKIQCYESKEDIPKNRPPAGKFTTYKGTDLNVSVPDCPYYAIHLDVENCLKQD